MTDRRVVITGLGAVTSRGVGVAETLNALLNGSSASEPAERVDTTAAHDAAVPNFSPRQFFRITKALKLTDRVAQLAIAAAGMALEDGGLASEDDGPAVREHIGVVIGSSGSDLQARDLARAIGPDREGRAVHDIPFFAEHVLKRLHPLWLLVNLPNMVSSHVAIQLAARGPNSTIMTDWVAGAQAIGEGADWIRRGDAEVVLAGGSDSGLYPFARADYEQGGLFEARDRRFVPAEGAAMLLLENRAAAIRRGARILAEIRGYATASAPADAAARSEGGALADTLRGALCDARWEPADVHRVFGATVFSDPLDEIERAALARVLGPALEQTRVANFTSRLGHALAAAGAIDVVLAVALSAREDAGTCRMICNSLGYSGQAASLAIQVDGAAEGTVQ